MLSGQAALDRRVVVGPVSIVIGPTWTDRAILLVRILVPLLAGWVDGWTAIVGTLVFQEVGLWVAGRLSPDRHFARGIFVAAYGLRAVAAAVLHMYLLRTTGNAALLLDDRTYDFVADWLVRISGGEALSIFPGHQYFLDNLYLYVVGGIYAALGHVPLVPKMLNAVLGGLTVVLIGELARAATRPVVGRVAAVFATLLPTLLLWSATGLKDALVLFGIVLGLRAIQILMATAPGERETGAALVALVGSLALTNDLRYAFFLILLGLVVAGALIRFSRRFPRKLVLSVVVVAAVVGAGTITYAQTRAPNSTVARYTRPAEIARVLSERRGEEAARARSQIGAVPSDDQPASSNEPDPADAATASLGGFVQAVGLALFAPAPWQAASLRDAAAATEMLIWYMLLACGLLSFWGPRTQPGFYGLLAFYGVVTVVALALTEGNLGNLLRHRMMMTPPLIVLGAAGAVLVYERWRSREPRPAPSR